MIGDTGSIPIEKENGGVPVNLQDQTTRPFSLRLNKYLQFGLTLATDAVINSQTITMTTGHGLIATDHIVLIQENGIPQFFFAEIISVNINELTLDTPVPYPFKAAETTVAQYDPDLNKDGSSNIYIAELINPFSFPVDITRLMFHMTDASDMDDGLFGGRAALTYGISLRKKITESDYLHYWNIKTNGGLGEIAYDKKYDEKAPSGVYGLTVRLSYAGQEKHGVAIRLDTNEALQILIQDDLTLLLSFTITAEGHYTQGE